MNDKNNDSTKIINDKTIHLCEYGCGQVASYQLKNGKWCCHESINSCQARRKINSETKKGKVPVWKNGHPRGRTGKIAWNRGKSTPTAIKDKIRTKVLEYARNNPGIVGRGRTAEAELQRIQRIKETARITNNIGGYRAGSGRGKAGWYKGYWCDSSWELAFVIYNIDHNIEFTRNKQSFEYIYNNKTHKYYPDFILNGVYIEIKGYHTEQSIAKIENFSGNIQLIDKHGIKKYLDYVIDIYGKEFYLLYENKNIKQLEE